MRRLTDKIFHPYQTQLTDEFYRTNQYLREHLENNLEQATIKTIDHSLRNLFAPMIGELISYEFKNLNFALKRLESQNTPKILGDTGWRQLNSQSVLLETIYKLKPVYLIGKHLKKVRISDSFYYCIDDSQKLQIRGITQNNVHLIKQDDSLIEIEECLDYSYAERHLLSMLESENKEKTNVLFIKSTNDLRFFLGAFEEICKLPQVIWDMRCLESLHDPVYLFRVNQVLDGLLRNFNIISVDAVADEGWVNISNIPVPRRVKLLLANKDHFESTSDKNLKQTPSSRGALDEGHSPPMFFDPSTYHS